MQCSHVQAPLLDGGEVANTNKGGGKMQPKEIKEDSLKFKIC